MTCAREIEVKEAMERGHWPDACGEELRGHVAGCVRCGEMVLIAEAFRGERVVAMKEAPLASPGAIWWKAQVRRRQEALKQIERPMLGAQVFALVITLLMGVGLVVMTLGQGVSWEGAAEDLHLEALWSFGGVGAVTLAVCAGVVAALGGVAVWLRMERR